MARCASGDQALLVRRRPGSLERGAGTRPRHPLRSGRIQECRRVPAGKVAEWPEAFISAAARVDTGRAQPDRPFQRSEGQFKDCRFGQGAYGGLWTENIVSGIARDILVEAMLRIEAAGFSITLHVHDELVCEVLEGFGSLEQFTRLMTRKPSWALDLPIAAKAWSGKRYCK